MRRKANMCAGILSHRNKDRLSCITGLILLLIGIICNESEHLKPVMLLFHCWTDRFIINRDDRPQTSELQII